MNTQKGNTLIAKFMGIEWSENAQWFLIENPETGESGTDAACLKYHSSWDWLMPVVENIGLIELPNGAYGKIIDFQISNEAIGWIFWLKNVPGDLNQPQSYPVNGTMIERTWQAVIEFIQYYNQNKQS